MKLEDFIKNNREGFDLETPSRRVWSQIEKDISPNKREEKMISLSVLYKAAASVVLLIGVGTVLGFYIGNARVANSNTFATEKYSEVEQYYKKQMEAKMNHLASYNVSPEVTADLEQMDQIYDEIQQDIRLDPELNEEKYINAIIKNYESRIAIMEKVLKRLNQHSVKKKNESYHEQIEI